MFNSKYDTGDYARYIPIEIMYGKLDTNFCCVLLNTYFSRM